MIDKEKLLLSVVIPAFNEAQRLPHFLRNLAIYLKNQPKFAAEVIVVDDGSVDATSGTAAVFKGQFDNLRLLRCEINSGKGAAVKLGVLAAAGDVILYIDADGSVAADEIGAHLHYILDQDYDICIGSRVIRDEQHILSARLHRRLIGWVFRSLVGFFLFDSFKDTQCGFKMFKRETGRSLFSVLKNQGFGFDLEILYLAYKRGYRIKEAPVSWHHVRGSKVKLLIDSLRMLRTILDVRARYSPIS